MSVWWSFALAGGSLLGTCLLAYKLRAGWLVCALINVAWVAYGTLSEQWGFVASGVIFIVTNTLAYVRWKRLDDERECTCAAGRRGVGRRAEPATRGSAV